MKAICVDRASGRVLHDVTLFEIDEPELICSSNSFASPTPVVDRGRVFCEFGALGTASVDAATGTVVWSRRVTVDHQVGPGSSPVVYGNLLILVRDGIDQQYVTALDQASGQTVWRADRPPLATASPSVRKAFSTPLVFQHASRDQMADGELLQVPGVGPVKLQRYGAAFLEAIAAGRGGGAAGGAGRVPGGARAARATRLPAAGRSILAPRMNPTRPITGTVAARIPYANAAPFYALWADAPFAVRNLPPRDRGREAEAGGVDLALMAAGDFLRMRDRFEMLAPMGVAARGAVLSVLLFSRRPASALGGALISVTPETRSPVSVRGWFGPGR